MGKCWEVPGPNFGGSDCASVRKRGFTLIEILIALVIFSLITAVISAVFIVAHRYSRLYQQVSRAQRETALAQQAMKRELSRCHYSTLHPSPAVNGTWALSCSPLQSSNDKIGFDSVSGEVLWRKWVGIWIDSDSNLQMAELPLSSPITLLDFDPTSAPTSIVPFNTRPRRRLAGSISSFRVFPEMQGLGLELEALTSLDSSRPTRYRLHTTFSTF